MTTTTARKPGNYSQPPTDEVLAITGITFRQLDFWVRQGWLCPGGGGGSGRTRVWSDDELRVARLMGRLVAAGLAPSSAHRVARGETEVGDGVHVLVLDDASAVFTEVRRCVEATCVAMESFTYRNITERDAVLAAAWACVKHGGS